MRRIQIIVNNGAGTGRAHRVWNETQCLLRGYKIKYEAHMTRYEGHAAKLAEQISRVKGEEPVYLLVVEIQHLMMLFTWRMWQRKYM